ncbi:hypothetical protein E4T52_09248 [Aureobasidium sp. EXF-3400]|nr:hypothetical protein E4T51_08374 [Aureobasidium sp. EXF-12344]KAI4775810.1 hypothetical protein E4T52_09248 [Aureobasidium sp. EXF-3400]
MSSSRQSLDVSANAEAEMEQEAEATLASSESLQTDMPMTMAASVVLDHLPRDAHTALSKAGLLDQDKTLFLSIPSCLVAPLAHISLTISNSQTNSTIVLLHFRPGPSTPNLPRGIQKYKMSSSLHFDAVIKFLRKKLNLQSHESVFCYVNQVFAPGLDEGVGNLWRCFRTGEELVVFYCLAQSFG